MVHVGMSELNPLVWEIWLMQVLLVNFIHKRCTLMFITIVKCVVAGYTHTLFKVYYGVSYSTTVSVDSLGQAANTTVSRLWNNAAVLVCML